MILGDGAKVFDLSQEKQELRDRYGKSKFGQSCLVARRLVERGIPYVTINYGGWDTHKENFQAMRRQLPDMDKGMATLLQDLSGRGLLDSTIVWWGGEFGRTPKVQWEAPWNGGRGHWGKVFSDVLAGGGFKGGQVIGASDAKGEEVKDPPGLSGGPHRQHLRADGHRADDETAESRRAADVRHAGGRRRHQVRRPAEGNHVRMKIFRIIAVSLFLGGAAFAQPGPHLAYVYPAGGKTGSTFQITVGGQFLLTVSNAFVTGPGVSATVLDAPPADEPERFQRPARPAESAPGKISGQPPGKSRHQRRLDGGGCGGRRTDPLEDSREPAEPHRQSGDD